jgi:hypothetical protein
VAVAVAEGSGVALGSGSGVEDGMSVAVAVGGSRVAARLVGTSVVEALGAQAAKIKIHDTSKMICFFIFFQLFIDNSNSFHKNNGELYHFQPNIPVYFLNLKLKTIPLNKWDSPVDQEILNYMLWIT